VGDFTVSASAQGSRIVGIAKVHVGPDDDEDGITNAVEDNAPNHGDGNGDDIPDSRQPNVTSLPSATGQGYVTIVTSAAENQEVWAYTEPQAAGGLTDPNCGYRYGLVGFRLHSTSAAVQVFFHGTASLDGFAYRRYGPLPPSFKNPQWYARSKILFGTATIGGHRVAYVRFSLADGYLGDDTGVDGWLVDPGGPAHASSDFNGDSVVDHLDLEFLAGQWLAGPGSGADLDDSGQVDALDFARFARDWLRQF